MHGILVAAHGSRSPQAQETMEFIMDKVRERVGKIPVALGFLGCGHPSIEEGLDQLRMAGITRITIIPYFLFQGIHVKETIPEIAEQYRNLYPQMQIEIGMALGEDERLADVLAERIRSTK